VAAGKAEESGRPAPGGVQALNPEGLHRSPTFSQGMAIDGRARTIYVGGQNGVDAAGKVVGGKGDLRAQTTRALDNLEKVLAAGGARLEHVVKMDIRLVAGQSLQDAFQAYQPRAAAFRTRPPVVTMSFVSGLGRPDYLIEIDAVAVLPEAPAASSR
jgi:enamine deaminase RidA (YjgF/YER057c/UK114 family)